MFYLLTYLLTYLLIYLLTYLLAYLLTYFMILELWKEAVVKNKSFVVLTTDLSKSSDCLGQYLLIPKMHAYGLQLPSFKLLQDYILNHQQKRLIQNLALG